MICRLQETIAYLWNYARRVFFGGLDACRSRPGGLALLTIPVLAGGLLAQCQQDLADLRQFGQ